MLYRQILILLCLTFLQLNASQTLYEDAEDLTTEKWAIFDNTPEGATINNTFDVEKSSQVITLHGDGTRNGYRIGSWPGREGAWNNQSEFILSVDMKFGSYYTFYVILETSQGRRYLYYSSQNSDRGILYSRYIHIGLGTKHLNNQWYTERRDLEADLHRYEPDNQLIAVHGILFRGSGSIDNIMLSKIHPSTLYEDAEDLTTEKWAIFDNTPEGATINNTFDVEKSSQVITLHGDGTRNGYRIGSWPGREGAWNNQSEFILSVDMKFGSYYTFYVILETSQGRRYLYYSSQNSDRGILYSRYIHIGLGTKHLNNQWYTERRDLEADLHRYEPDNQLIAVHGILFRGTGSIDNIMLSKIQNVRDNHPFAAIRNMIHNEGQKTDYICVGDSTRAISHHEGQYLFNEVSNALSAYGVTSHLLARRGHKASQFLNESDHPTWRDVVAVIPNDGTYAIVDICLGINDYWGGDGESIFNSITQAISRIKSQKPNTKFILSMPNRVYIPDNARASNRQTDYLKDIYLRLSQTLNLPLNNVVDAVMPSHESTQASWYRDDGYFVHMSREGQHLVAQYILSNLTK